MSSTVRQIAYRLKSEGKAELLRDQREVADGFRGTYAAAEQGAAAASTATERQERRYKALAQAAREAEAAAQSQARFNAALGIRPANDGAARDSAAVFAALEEQERRAKALRAQLDPLGAAQDRLNDELREYQQLAAAGRISTIELEQAQAQARKRFDDTTASMDRQTRGLSRLAIASRLNLARQGADVAVTAAMGMNPAMIAIQQGPQILDAWATSGFTASRSMLLLGGSLAAAAAAAGVAVLAWNDAEKASIQMDRAATGLGLTAGLTGDQLKQLAETNADLAKISAASARDQAAAYVSTGRIGAEQIAGLIGISRDYAAFMNMDMKTATASLAQAMSAPDKAARDMTNAFGLLDQKTLDYIDTLVKHGRESEAQDLIIKALEQRVEGFGDKLGTIESAWDRIALAAQGAWEWMGKALETTSAERIDGLQRAVAGLERTGNNPELLRRLQAELWTLQGAAFSRDLVRDWRADDGRANMEAERRRRRLAAARSGRSRGDGDAERDAREALQRTRREEDRASAIQIEVAQATERPDLVQSLREEVALRERIRQLVDDGHALDAAREKAQAERKPLLDARAVAIERETRLLGDQAALEAERGKGNWASVRELEDAAERRRVILTYQEKGLDIAEATRLAETDLLYLADGRAAVMKRMVEDAERVRDIDLARLSGREDEARRLEQDERVRRRAREIEQREGLDAGKGDQRARAEIAEELDAEREGVRRAWVKSFADDIRRSGIRQALTEQFQTAGDRLLDRLIDGLMDIDWAAFFARGEGGGRGSNSWVDWAARAASFFVGRNADGTDYWRGGLTWVGERGPEIINAPRGSQIFDHGRSMRMAAAAAQGVAAGGKIEMTVKLDMPPGYVGDRQLASLLQQTAEAGANEGAKRALAGMRDAQTQLQVHRGG